MNCNAGRFHLILFILICLSVSSYSQTFMKGIGAGVVIQSTTGYRTEAPVSVVFAPRFIFLESAKESLSVGLPISIAFRGAYHIRNEDAITLALMLNAPLMIDYNYGAGSGKKNGDGIGYFIGAGFGYQTNIIKKKEQWDQGYTDIMSGSGPACNAGIRLAVGKHQHNIEFRFFYMKTLDVSRSDIVGIGCMFNY